MIISESEDLGWISSSCSLIVISDQAVHNVPPNVCLFTYEITGCKLSDNCISIYGSSNSTGTVLLNITAAEGMLLYLYSPALLNGYFIGIQAFRTWAVWNNDRWLGIFLGVSLLASLFPTGIMMNRYLKSLKCSSLNRISTKFGLTIG